MNPALVTCLQAMPQSRTIKDVADWWAVWRSLGPIANGPAARAIAGGFAADRVGWAFASGYQAALHALVPDLSHDTLAAFCVTEAQGNRPRDIRTTITPQADGMLRIEGAKRWTTLGPSGAVLLIVGALAGASDAKRPALRVAQVPVPTPGLVLKVMPATRFVPEVPHAEVLMQDLRVSAGALLPGDGYDRYVKPFRTIEDLHVTLAVLAYLLREARARRWPAVFTEQLVATWCCFRSSRPRTRMLQRRMSRWPARCMSRTDSTRTHSRSGPQPGRRPGRDALAARCGAFRGCGYGTPATRPTRLGPPGRRVLRWRLIATS